MFEGYLRKWVSILSGWTLRYFIIHNGLLSMLDKKGGKRKATVALRIATISTIKEDPLRIIIHTGTHEIHVRADDPQEAKRWCDALKQEQENTIMRDERDEYDNRGLDMVDRNLSPRSKALAKTINMDFLKQDLADVWCCQAELDETLSLMSSKAKSIPSLHDQMNKLEQLGRDLKYRLTACVTKLEEEKNKMVRTVHKLDTVVVGEKRNFTFAPNPFYLHNIQDNQGHDDSGTVFQSFESEEEDYDQNERISPDLHKIYQPPSRQVSGINLEASNTNMQGLVWDGRINGLNPLVKKILMHNAAFLETSPIPKDLRREKMPYWLDPNQKMNIWAVVKDMIGKDLSKFAVPVWLNEPLSMLQKLCEQLEYSRLLDIAAQKDDSCLRMAYVMSFAFSYYAGTIGRHKKPFNPILGETFEYVPVDGSFRFISEQVSHHPPISAGFADSGNYQWWGDTQIKTSFRGTSIDAVSLGSCHVVLKRHDDHIVYKRPTTGVQNLILGTMYLENYGEMPFRNSKTGDTGQLTLKKRGWGDRGAYETEGWIKDRNGIMRYTLHGKWNSYLSAVDVMTKQEIKLWERNQIPENYEQQYCFSNYAKQLNYLYEDLVPKLPATDCRFRPDQRALEYGFLDLARDEKFRLEEKQRARRKELQNKGETHVSRWFKEIKDSVTEEKGYVYTGGYWESRERGSYGDVLDLF